MTKINYTAVTFLTIDGDIDYATVNKNNTCTTTLFYSNEVPKFVRERVALLRVNGDSPKVAVEGVGRKLMDNMYTVYLNKEEYNYLINQRKSANEKQTSNPSVSP
jgi:hypothetical protein